MDKIDHIESELNRLASAMFNNGITLDEAVAALRQEYAQILSETADMVRRDAVRQQPIGATW